MSKNRSLTLKLLLALGLTPAVPAMDLVRQATRADIAYAKYGATGKGVTVVIFDRGIDWTHPDFIKPGGATRIKGILDMTGQNGCDPANPAPVEFTEAQINTALKGGVTINTRDAVGHGSMTAGIAAGNGRAALYGKYRGIAPEADLLIVKMVSDGVPAHGTQAAEPAFSGCITQAFDWADQKITQLNQPAVGIMNSGVLWGPLDGTSVISRKIDQVFGLDRPGRVYISPSGDEGNLAAHAGVSYTGTSDTVVHFNRTTTDPAFLQIWCSGSAPATITVTLDDGTTTGPVVPNASSNVNGVQLVQYLPGQEPYPITSTTGDRWSYVSIAGHQGAGSVIIRGQASAGHADLYIPLSSTMKFTDSLVPGRLTDYSSTLSAIVVGASVNRTSWTSIDGNAVSDTSQGLAGQFWPGSGVGPSRDGRTYGVDITAPGEYVFASIGASAYYTTLRPYLAPDGNGLYWLQQETSGAAPIVVGAVAQMLQLKPTLTGRQTRQILHDTAASDASTGTTPNVNWGYGKLDLLRAADALGATGTPPAPSALARLKGDLQSAQSGATLASLQVALTDQHLIPMQGVTVTWAVTAGSGQVTKTSVTDSNGVATAVWTLGSVGSNALIATVTGVTPVGFTATATLAPPPPPVISAIVNGASFANAPLSGGSIASIFGASLAPQTLSAGTLPLPATLANTSVLVNGVAAPLFYVSAGQINFLLPWEVTGQSHASVAVLSNGATGTAQNQIIAACSPAIFTIGGSQGAIQIANSAIFAAPLGSVPGAQARPAAKGEFLTIYGSGLGDVTLRPVTGSVAVGDTPVTNAMPTVLIGGIAAPVTFSGLSPGFVGLYQVNVQVPATAPSGSAIPLVLTQKGITANLVTIAIE